MNSTSLDDVKLSENTNPNIINVDREEFDKKCSRYSTGCFLLGVLAIAVYGIVTFN